MLRALLCLALAGCASPPPPQRGGGASTTLHGLGNPPATRAELAQGDNAAGISAQRVERTETRQTAAPPAPAARVTETFDGSGAIVSRVTDHFAPPAVLTSQLQETTDTQLGAAQKDTSREITASLAAMRPVQFGGLAFLAVALACLHPVVRRTFGGGKTVPAVAAALGVVLVFGPQLFAGRETLALVLAVVALVILFLAVRAAYHERAADDRKNLPA